MDNKKKLLVISYLRKNSRVALTEMSKNTHIPVSTIYDNLKNNDVIVRHTCLLDYPKLGYGIRASVMLKVDAKDRESLKQCLVKHKSINSVYRVNNGYDFMLDCIFKQLKDLEEFMDGIEGKFKIVGKDCFFIIQEIKTEEFMSDPALVGLVQ